MIIIKPFISFNSLCLIAFLSWPLACFRKLDGFWINVLKKKCESEIRFSRPLTSEFEKYLRCVLFGSRVTDSLRLSLDICKQMAKHKQQFKEKKNQIKSNTHTEKCAI